MPALAICGKVTWPLRKMIALGGVPINVALREKRLTLLEHFKLNYSHNG